MEVTQPLIIKSPRQHENRILRVIAHVDKTSQQVRLEYNSITQGQKVATRHANCVVEYGSPEKWLRRWSHSLHLVQGHIKELETKANLGEISKVTSRLAYRLFSSLVDYAPEYQRMSQVLLASNLYEASATVSLDERGDDASFQCSPYWIDSLAHLSGFVMNGNENINYQDAVYISHGWESMRFAQKLVSGGQYQTYVRMLPVDKTMFGGDVWILHEGEIVGVIEDLRFQRVPRSILDMLLPPVRVNAAKETAKETAKQVAPNKKRSQPVIPKAQAPPTQVNSNTTEEVKRQSEHSANSLLDLIAGELGLAASEISPKDNLSELGVDSLMALTLVSRLREEMDLDITHSNFLELSTISQLLDFLNEVPHAVANDIVGEGPSNDQAAGHYSSSPSSGSSFVEAITPDSSAEDTLHLVRHIILEETGLAEDELEVTADLASLGIDSLMSLTVLGKLREEGVELPMDFFLHHTTMDEVSQALVSGNNDLRPEDILPSTKERGPEAKSILLQKRSNPTSSKTLFLFPDGSGSPASYAGLQQLHADFEIYGLVCPFVNDPGSYTGDIEDVVRIYLSAIKNHSPSGPYHLGGWSVGGVLAYEASKQLIDSGEKVHDLVLIDAPCPTVLAPMSDSLIEFLNSIGVLGGTQTDGAALPNSKRRLLLDHFDATVKNLGTYDPARSPISVGSSPRTSIIWAQEGVCDGLNDPRRRANPSLAADATASWILDKRTDSGPRGWESLISTNHISSFSVPGNHFSMMQPSNASIPPFPVLIWRLFAIFPILTYGFADWRALQEAEVYSSFRQIAHAGLLLFSIDWNIWGTWVSEIV
jgi:iron transport multicopper oxidase